MELALGRAWKERENWGTPMKKATEVFNTPGPREFIRTAPEARKASSG